MNETHVALLYYQIKKEGHHKTDLVCSLKGVKPFISQCVPRIVECQSLIFTPCFRSATSKGFKMQ